MLLLAEAQTINGSAEEALKTYQEILDARGGATGAVDDSNKDIFRRMAPLLQQLENYIEAAQCLEKVLREEKQEILKVGLWTKIAGNYKKAGEKERTLNASKQAYEIMLRVQGLRDPQTQRCKLNLAQVYQAFDNEAYAKRLYNEYLEQFGKQNGENGLENWSDNPTFTKMRDFAEAQIAAIDKVDEGEEEEYYDEEEGEAEEDDAPAAVDAAAAEDDGDDEDAE